MSEIDKIKRAMMLAYVGDVGCTLTNEDCNDLTKYISGLELEVKSLTARAEEAETGNESRIHILTETRDMALARAEAAERKVEAIAEILNTPCATDIDVIAVWRKAKEVLG